MIVGLNKGWKKITQDNTLSIVDLLNHMAINGISFLITLNFLTLIWVEFLGVSFEVIGRA